jgi:hypothetical protein
MGQQHVREQAEAFHRKAEGHKGEAGAVPGQQGTFGRHEYAGIIQFRHS